MQQYRDSDAMAWSLGLGRGSSSSSAGQSASDSESDSDLSSTGCQARLVGLRVPAPAAWIAPVFAWHWNAGRASRPLVAGFIGRLSGQARPPPVCTLALQLKIEDRYPMF